MATETKEEIAQPTQEVIDALYMALHTFCGHLGDSSKLTGLTAIIDSGIGEAKGDIGKVIDLVAKGIILGVKPVAKNGNLNDIKWKT